MKTVVPPHIPDFKAIRTADKTHDFDSWYRESQPAVIRPCRERNRSCHY